MDRRRRGLAVIAAVTDCSVVIARVTTLTDTTVYRVVIVALHSAEKDRTRANDTKWKQKRPSKNGKHAPRTTQRLTTLQRLREHCNQSAVVPVAFVVWGIHARRPSAHARPGRQYLLRGPRGRERASFSHRRRRRIAFPSRTLARTRHKNTALGLILFSVSCGDPRLRPILFHFSLTKELYLQKKISSFGCIDVDLRMRFHVNTWILS